MVKATLTNRSILDRIKPVELVLEQFSFAGGENTVAEDAALETNEARVIKNWDIDSLTGMKRAKGFTEAADDGSGAPDYSGEPYDLLAHHFEGTNTELYGVINGDLVIKSSTDINQEDASAFTADALCNAVSAGDALWITNSTDNLKRKTIGNNIAAAGDTPANACERIYEHQSRLLAEGNSARTVYGSVVGSGNWNGASAWGTSNDSWSMTFNDLTKGLVPGFPSGTDVTAFTQFDTFVIQNQPNVTRRRITNGIGCAAPDSIDKGNEGVFFISDFPTLGVFLWDSVNFINLTENNDFIDNVNLDQRIFGIYRDRKYYLFYNETGSGVTYTNRLRIYDAQFGRWMQRPVNTDLGDNFGYPALATKDANELFVGSSRGPKLYQLEDTNNSDAGNNTEANYKTKVFTSKDMSVSSGGAFPIDNVRMKLVSATVVFNGTTGAFSINADIDRGNRTAEQTFQMNIDGGDRINDDFTVNTSKILSSDFPDKQTTKTFKNGAVGREFQFQIINNNTGVRPEIKRIKYHFIVMEEL